MCLRLLTITITIWGLAAVAPGQAPTRTQKSTGATLTLPDGWSWTSQFGDSVSIKLPLEVKGRKEEATGNLFTSPGRFVGARIDELRLDSTENPRGYVGFKVKEKQRFAKQRNVVFISYVKKRGSEPERLYDRRHWIWRNGGVLFEWREEVRKEASGTAARGFYSAQRSMKFTTPDGKKPPDKIRDYPNQRVRYKIHADWDWNKGKEGSSVRLPDGQHLLFVALTETIVKGQRKRLGIILQSVTTPGTLRQVIEANQRSLRQGWEEVKDFEVREKVPFQGEKATLVTFTGINSNASKSERFFSDWYVFKHKKNVFLWNEFGPEKAKKTALKQLKKARNGLKPY